MLSQWYWNAGQWHRRRNIRYPATTGQALRAARPRAVLALDCCDHRGPDAVSCPKCTQSTSEMGDPEQFHGKSECGLVKILRYAQDDSVDIRIGIILKGAAVRLHAKSARRWALWSRARKGWVSGTGVRFSMGSCPKGGCFGHGCGLSSP